MTVEVFTPAPTYTVSGIGPYAIGHPYVAGSIRALVTVSGVEVALAPGDITVTPAAAAVSGSLFLSAGAAATHAGRVLRIERVTVAEQGWVGVQGEREKGLETQLDRTTYSLQELVAIISRSLRTRDALPAFVPQAGRTLVYDGTAIIAGPLASDIEAAVAQAAVFRGTWVTGAAYAFRDQIFEPVSGNGYQCLIAHTAGSFSTDLAAGRWAIYVQRGASGAGSGDMVASQNLNDLLDKNAARAILGVTLPNLGVTASAAELNILDGVTKTTAMLNAQSDDDRLINGNLAVWQRGTSTSTDGGFAADRWRNLISGGGAATQSQQAHALGTTFGVNNPGLFLRQSVSGQSLVSDRAATTQRIENVRTYAGQTVTVMGWAKRGSGTGNMAVEMLQFFGTGGSPSATVSGIGAVQVALTGSWAPFAVTIAIPSVATKITGSNNDDYLELLFYSSAGSNFNARTGSLGIQTIGVDLWGVHIRVGTFTTADVDSYVAPAFEAQLVRCQKFYETGFSLLEGYQLSGNAVSQTAVFKATKRTNPVMSIADNGSAFLTATFSAPSVSADSARLTGTKNGVSGAFLFSVSWTARAEL